METEMRIHVCIRYNDFRELYEYIGLPFAGGTPRLLNHALVAKKKKEEFQIQSHRYQKNVQQQLLTEV